MNLTLQVMAKAVAATGFGAEPLEKVFRLMGLLDALNSHPFLKPRIALKGGTALNLFHFEVPRLSVDIDLNYIVAVDRERMTKWVQHNLDHQDRHGYGIFCANLKENDELVGVLGLHHVQVD